MTQYIIRRLLQMIPITLGILTLIFSLIHLIPGDPAIQIAGENARAEDVERVRLLALVIAIVATRARLPERLAEAMSGV
mgnify:CR=1 FL=1